MKRRVRESPFSLFSFQDIITGLCGIMIFLVLVQVGDLVRVKGAAAEESDEGLMDDRRTELRREIAELNRRLAALRRESAKVIQVPKDRVNPAEKDRLVESMTEKSRIIAALVSQVHDLETQVEKARETDAQDREKIKEMERTRRLLEQQIAGMSKRRGVTLIPERGEYKVPMFIVCSWKGLEIHRPFEKDCPVKTIAPEEVAKAFGAFLSELDHTTHTAVLLVRPTGVGMMDKAAEILRTHNVTYGRDPIEESVEIAFQKEARE